MKAFSDLNEFVLSIQTLLCKFCLSSLSLAHSRGYYIYKKLYVTINQIKWNEIQNYFQIFQYYLRGNNILVLI